MSEPVNVDTFIQDVFRDTWNLFKRDPALFLIAGLIVAFLSLVTLGIMAGPLAVGFIGIVRKRRRNEAATSEEVFAAMPVFATCFVIAVLVLIAAAIGFALLVLPGFAVLYAVMFVFPPVAYRDADVVGALRDSFELVKRHFMPTLILFLLLVALNAVAAGSVLGVLLTLPFGLIALTIGYEKLTGQEPAAAAAAGAPASPAS
jgi:hypothetical protein